MVVNPESFLISSLVVPPAAMQSDAKRCAPTAAMGTVGWCNRAQLEALNVDIHLARLRQDGLSPATLGTRLHSLASVTANQSPAPQEETSGVE